MTLFLLILFFSLVGGLFSLLGGVLLLRKDDTRNELFIHLLSFAAGAMLATAFLDILPEAAETGLSMDRLFQWTFGAFIASFLLEGIFLRFHHHEATHRITATPWLLVVSDSIHNCIDGIAIAAAFLVNVPLGIITALAVAVHEIPQEIGDFSILLNAGWQRRKVLLVNILSSLFAVVGALLTLALRDTIQPVVGFFLAMIGGIFIYIGASDLVPELYHTTRRDKLTHVTLLFLAGIATIALALAVLPHE